MVTNKIIQDFDDENDILFINWGGQAMHSREFLNGRIVFDFDKDNNVVGFQFFGWNEEVDKSNKEIEKLFKLSERRRKKK